MTTQTPSIDLPPDAITAPSPSPSSATSPSPTSTYPPRQTNSSRVNLEHLTPPTSDPTVSAAAEAQQHADVEKSPPEASTPPPLDIEHLVVHDDPRLWSRKRKNCILAVIAFCGAGGTLTASIYFPALDSLQADLGASDNLLAASVSLFILGQGIFPVFWSALSEIKGRKICYISAITIYIIATIVCSRATTISLFIIMRVFQALGSGAVLALGAGTLADIFDNHERGTKLGIFYGVPLMGPSIGPLLGGAITQKASWRATFYFLIGFGVISLATMIWLPETFRKERSLAWRLAMERARAHAKADLIKARAGLPVEGEEEERKTTKTSDGRKTAFLSPTPSRLQRNDHAPTTTPTPTFSPLQKVVTALSLRSGEDNVKIHLRDINPFAATGAVLTQRHNFLAILYSGMLFASSYTITYSSSRTFAAEPYGFGALKVGLVLLCFGVGNVVGSVGGGKYSDLVFNRLKEKNGGKGEPEMRIKSTYVPMVLMPPLFIGYAWAVEKHVPIYGPLIILFFLGTATIALYSSLLAYVVDSNPGRSSSAVACNSLFRGVLAAAASQAVEPIIDRIGNGAFYSGFAVVLAVGELGLLWAGARGQQWRERYAEKEALKKLEAEEKERE